MSVLNTIATVIGWWFILTALVAGVLMTLRRFVQGRIQRRADRMESLSEARLRQHLAARKASR